MSVANDHETIGLASRPWTGTANLRTRESRRLDCELEAARQAYRQVSPDVFYPIPGLDYSGANLPAFEVGGDYFDFFELSSSANPRLGVAIGDVSGKGMPAALLVPALRASLRGVTACMHSELTGLMTVMNRLVHHTLAPSHFATLFYGEFDLNTRELRFVNAGHNPPVVIREHQERLEVERLDAGGKVLGLFEDCAYEQGSITLRPKDLVVAFTDGLAEAENSEGDFWGDERLIQTIAECSGLSASDTIKNVLNTVRSFTAGTPQRDDIALVALCVL